jgi:uncharacterized membrane protein YqaE (UPF0057 family)
MSCETVDFNKQSFFDKAMYGGLGYGTVCVPKNLPDYLIMIAFPPAYVFRHQMRRDFKNIEKILVCFILTCCLYFPGLIYAMNLIANSDASEEVA